ncbi:FecR family protein [Brucella intermedia]|uniref:FecR family protein n=1 Tax=Brucella intermedia TaxID=94625 RepID=UPI001E463863|nr:FecR family protein [Brucella intermedia]MCB4919578.1 FecR family protein [Brucella intermedia]
MTSSDDRDSLEEAAEWFFRQDGRSLSAGDDARFRAWLAASDENRAAYAEISGTWHELGNIPNPAACPPRHFWRRVTMPIAAAFAGICVLAGGTWYLDVPMRVMADGYTAVGELQTLTLPDGSLAEMNSGTAIAVAYSSGERRIRVLKGEAVFTVSADAQRPFIVEAHGGTAAALGTVYAVREDSDGATVTVIESHVAISPDADAQPLRIGAGQRIRYENGHLGPVEFVDAVSETAWRRRKLIFIDRPLGEVVDELNRYHKGMIRIVDSAIRSRRVSGVFETDDIIKVVDALEKSFGFSDTRLGNFVILIHR